VGQRAEPDLDNLAKVLFRYDSEVGGCMWTGHSLPSRILSLTAKELGLASALALATDHAAGIQSIRNHHGDSYCL
jgi:hypothetical protein